MKKVIVLAMACLLFGSASVLANDKPKKKVRSSLTEQIQGMLSGAQYELKHGEMTAEVTLIINGDSELVVLDVDNADQRLESLLKSRLNYKLVVVGNTQQGQIFKLPVRVKA